MQTEHFVPQREGAAKGMKQATKRLREHTRDGKKRTPTFGIRRASEPPFFIPC